MPFETGWAVDASVLLWSSMLEACLWHGSVGGAPAGVTEILRHIRRELQCLLHMPWLRRKLLTFAVRSAVPRANSTWGICSKRCDTKRHICKIYGRVLGEECANASPRHDCRPKPEMFSASMMHDGMASV